MKNILKLHEAIAVVLLNCDERKASIDFIAKEINRRKLYVRKDNKLLPAYQVMMRTKLNGGKYSNLFKIIDKTLIQLK